MYKLFITLMTFLIPVNVFTYSVSAQDRFFKVEAVDTMKISRDAALSTTDDQIASLVKKVADLHPTHIAIATPYDERFSKTLSTWVKEGRKNRLNIWFRGNFSAWEGWFNTPKLTNYADHHKMTYAFITSHPDLFEDGDIFTPLPEPENGGPGDPRGDAEKSAQFNQFLIDSYDNCVKAFAQIHKNVTCGYFSTNGDVAKDVITKDTVKRTGNRIVIDHYVKDPAKLVADIQYLHQKFDAPVVLGEFGAPIPDIHGDMTDEQQKEYIQNTFKLLVKNKDIIEGVNYWTAFGGSTQVFDDLFEPKPASTVLWDYFQPLQLSGQVRDLFGTPISGVSISSDAYSTVSDAKGNYSFLTTRDAAKITVHNPNYRDLQFDLKSASDGAVLTQTFILDYQRKDFFLNLKAFLHKLLAK